MISSKRQVFVRLTTLLELMRRRKLSCHLNNKQRRESAVPRNLFCRQHQEIQKSKSKSLLFHQPRIATKRGATVTWSRRNLTRPNISTKLTKLPTKWSAVV